MKSDQDTKVATDDGQVEDWGRMSEAVVDSLKEWRNLLKESLV